MVFMKLRYRFAVILFFISVMIHHSLVSAEDKIIKLEKGVSCITSSCHEKMGQKKYSHVIGVDAEKCYICHELIQEDEHIFRDLPQASEALCGKCHKQDIPEPKKAEEPKEKKSLAFEDIIGKMSEVQSTEADEISPEKLEPNLKPPKLIAVSDDVTLHKPYTEGKCTACHDAHESNYKDHLKLQYPDGLYKRFSGDAYDMCFTADCHKGLEYAFEEPRTLDLTLFRNGNVNLHYRHVNKKKGRSCRACHHGHGTKNPKLIKDAFKFGNQMLTVGFEKNEDGGKCATTCHRLAVYNRYAPEFNLIKTTLLPGADATDAELRESRERDLKRQENKQ